MFRIVRSGCSSSSRRTACTCRPRAARVYDPKGEYQIVCEHMEPQGLGALQLAFDQLKRRLQAEGLFDPARKRPLPALPRKIGIVTSLDGAAIRDIIKVLSRRYPNAHLVIRPTRVQGEGAASANRCGPRRHPPASPQRRSSPAGPWRWPCIWECYGYHYRFRRLGIRCSWRLVYGVLRVGARGSDLRFCNSGGYPSRERNSCMSPISSSKAC